MNNSSSHQQQQSAAQTSLGKFFSNKAPSYFKLNQSNDATINQKVDHKDDEKHAKLVAHEETPVFNESKGSKGMQYMFLSALCFTVTAFLLKLLYLNSNISTYEFTYWNSIVIGVLNLALIKYNQKDHLLVRVDMRTTLVWRSISAFIGISGFYLAVQYTDLSKATVLFWTNPMITAALGYFMINEALTFVDWLAIFSSFAGILVVQNPWDKLAETGKTYEDSMGTIAALVGSLFFSIAQVQTRKMGKKVNFLTITLYQTIFSAFIAPLLMIVFLRYRTAHTTHYGLYEVGMIILISFTMFLSQIFSTKAFQNDKAGRITPVNQLQIIFNWILDYFIIAHVPTHSELIGGVLIVFSNLIVSLLRCFNLIK